MLPRSPRSFRILIRHVRRCSIKELTENTEFSTLNVANVLQIGRPKLDKWPLNGALRILCMLVTAFFLSLCSCDFTKVKGPFGSC